MATRLTVLKSSSFLNNTWETVGHKGHSSSKRHLPRAERQKHTAEQHNWVNSQITVRTWDELVFVFIPYLYAGLHVHLTWNVSAVNKHKLRVKLRQRQYFSDAQESQWKPSILFVGQQSELWSGQDLWDALLPVKRSIKGTVHPKMTVVRISAICMTDISFCASCVFTYSSILEKQLIFCKIIYTYTQVI